MTGLVLHGYWRSSATYRVRIALSVKGLAFAQVTHDLRAGAQSDPAYLALAPHGLVPALAEDDAVLIESPAILEWIEARWPTPPLLPSDAMGAAVVRGMAALIGCDIHPLANLRVLNRLRATFGATNEQVRDWIAHWISTGFTALERMCEQHGGLYAYGASPTLADVYLVPQIYNARRYRVDLSPYPRLVSASDAAAALPAFAAAHPDIQPDADA